MSKWQEVLGWTPEQLDELRFVGYSYVKQGKYDIALPIFEALVSLHPASVYNLQTLGAIYLETGKNLQALSTMEKALKLEPDHGETLLNRTKALFALGYRRQGASEARRLAAHSSKPIADAASALLTAYS
jgi:tetratricopeptide (TPR) repeat protein